MSNFKRFLSLFLTAVMLIGVLSVCMPVMAADTATITIDGNGGIGIPADITVNKGTVYHERYTTNAPATLYCVWGNPVACSAEGGTFPATGTDRQEEFVVGHNGTVVDTKISQ